MPRLLATSATLLAGPRADSEVYAQLKPGETFEVLELAGDRAWGVAPAHKLVGYVPAAVLERPAA